MVDLRERRHTHMRRRIVDAAWAAAAEHGIAELTLRHVADRLGMRPPSLYEYVEGKNAIYDLLFADGYQALVEHVGRSLDDVDDAGDPEARLSRTLGDFLAFCREDPARYRLMFTRSVPGWEPSESAYEHSVEAWQRMLEGLATVGITRPEDVDLYVAVSAGLAIQQDANDPAGQRYAPLAPAAARMFLHHLDREYAR